MFTIFTAYVSLDQVHGCQEGLYQKIVKSYLVSLAPGWDLENIFERSSIIFPKALLSMIQSKMLDWPVVWHVDPRPSRQSRDAPVEEQRNRSIWSKISEYHLDLWTWLMCMPTGSRWVSNKNITRCHRWLESVPVQVAVGVSWGKDASVRISLQTDGLWPSLTHGWAAHPECERSAAMVRRTWGQYVSVCPCL